MVAPAHYTRSKGKSREQSTVSSHHHMNQRMAKECARAYGRAQVLMYEHAAEFRDLPEEASLVEVLDEHRVFSHGYGISRHDRLAYVSEVVAKLKQDGIVLTGYVGGFHLASKAKEYQRAAAQRAAAVEQEVQRQMGKPDVDAPGFSFKAWNEQLRAAS